MSNLLAQDIARGTMEKLREFIAPGVTERQIKEYADRCAEELGSAPSWYHGIGALVLCGERSTVSGNGRAYVPSDIPLHGNDIITVDLHPNFGPYWGDYARTFILEDGRVAMDLDSIRNAEYREGLETQLLVHRYMAEIVTPEMTYHEAAERINGYIASLGYRNLDYKHCLGHSINSHQAERVYIEPGENTPFGAFRYWTFEPHLAKIGGSYGFKHENIYYFAESGKVTAL